MERALSLHGKFAVMVYLDIVQPLTAPIASVLDRAKPGMQVRKRLYQQLYHARPAKLGRNKHRKNHYYCARLLPDACASDEAAPPALVGSDSVSKVG